MKQTRLRSGGFALVLAAGLLVSACGTRVGQRDVAAGAGGEVVFPASELDRIRAAAAEGAAEGLASARPDAATLRSGSLTAGPSLGSTAPGPAAGAVPDPVAASAAGRATVVRGAQGASAAAGSATGVWAARKLTTGAAAATSTAAAGTARKATGAGAPAPISCDAPGEPIRLGQVGNFTGVLGPVWASAKTALAVWAKDVNARGGVACHPVVLYQQDDGGDPARSASAVQDLVENKKVVALVSSFTVLSLNGFTSAVQAARVPSVGGDVLGEQWTSSPYLFPQGGGVLGQILAMLKLSIDQGHKRFGMVYCVETSVCSANKKIFAQYAGPMGGSWDYEAPISLTQPDFTAQCQNAKTAGVDVLIMGMDGSAIQRLGRSCTAVDYHPLLIATGLALGETTSSDPNLRRFGILTANLIAPWMLDDVPGQREFHKALRTYVPDQPPDGPGITSWAAGKLFEAAFATLGEDGRRPVTTATVMQALGGVRGETLGGLAPPISFALGQKHAPVVVAAYHAQLGEKGWTAPHGSRPVRVAASLADASGAGARPGLAAPAVRLRRTGP